MTDIVSVRFKDSGKIYYFSPGEYKISPGEYVIVETARGVECAKAVSGNKTVSFRRLSPFCVLPQSRI